MVTCIEKLRDLLEHPRTWAISSRAVKTEGSTTIPRGSTPKRVEALSILKKQDDDIVWTAWKHAAAKAV